MAQKWTWLSRSIHRSLTQQLLSTYNRTAKPPNMTSHHVVRVTDAWDHFQSQMKCCGVNGPKDYMSTSWFNSSNENLGLFVPESCCQHQQQQHFLHNNNNNDNYYKKQRYLSDENLYAYLADDLDANEISDYIMTSSHYNISI
ncbi:hypothetical protein HELRODRAFT_182522 [Helobdella robusta]|uniref:Uncharacterized protein n=1 Tax=Helobdella robusta TaxID=6412 RepID=T1FIB3_HELRO|nr:hypothetical protein HELRODRAFT_182522 [Helobdella robusta]ESN90930.1 hypothetical protein HELRODRAFT_182522 [Helobdella robusta]